MLYEVNTYLFPRRSGKREAESLHKGCRTGDDHPNRTGNRETVQPERAVSTPFVAVCRAAGLFRYLDRECQRRALVVCSALRAVQRLLRVG